MNPRIITDPATANVLAPVLIAMGGIAIVALAVCALAYLRLRDSGR